MLVSSIGGLRQIIVDASSYKFYQWEGKKAKKVEILLGQILYRFVRARKICSF
jgi:hypothetical protein